MSGELEGAASADIDMRAPGDIAIAAQPASVGPDAGLAEMVPGMPVPAAAPRGAADGGVPLAVWAGALAVLVLLLLAWLLRV